MPKKIRLGELLLNNKVITQDQLNAAIEEQKSTGQKLGETLVSLGFITENALITALSAYLKIPQIDLSKTELNFELAQELPESYARRFNAVLLKKTSKHALVGMSDPLDIPAVDELRRFLKTDVELVFVTPSDLLRTFDLIYRRQSDISGFAKSLEKELAGPEKRQSEERRTTDRRAADYGPPTKSDAPVIQLLESLFEDAIQVNASDIHIEPDRNVLRIRLRIDGVLHEQIIKEKAIAEALASRLKLVANLNIAEKRLPQDGRFTIKVRNRLVDVRFSTLPTQYGESLVMRLLDQSAGILNLEKIGMNEAMLKRFRRLIHNPNGLILVTGPTGSGKSTTLYGALEELNHPDRKIITVEDPVEYRLSRINQVQVNPKLDLSFIRILRTALRQDPDVMLIGEMRDEETARVGMQASLTGHLVLSTLHTNDSASTALRLMDMGIEGYLVAATLRGILAQRLIRKICDNCKENYQPDAREHNWLEGVSKLLDVKPINEFSMGKGCMYCNHTGFHGRIGVFELLELDPDMMGDLRKQDPAGFSDHAAKALKGKLLVDSGMNLIKSGVTTISEVIRMFGEV